MKWLKIFCEFNVVQWINRLWYQKKIKWYLNPLIPLSYLYQLILFLRKTLYKLGIKRTTKFPIPVIIVGNLSVGGTGKTPLVTWLVKFLREQGYTPGIVSRGYGSKAKYFPQVVTTASHPMQVGDEPLMLKLQTDCPVVVSPKRTEAVQRLLQDYPCDIVISDDGLQHYSLARDIEIAVIDGERQLGNGYCLPLGPLRESSRRLATVDFVVVNGGEAQGLQMQLVPGDFVSLQIPQKTLTAADLVTCRLIAVAAIGHPKRFFQTLSQLGLQFESRVFRDHHHYQKSDFSFAKEDDLIIMTEKDAVKCRAFADARFYFLPVTAVLPKDFPSQLLQKLTPLLLYPTQVNTRCGTVVPRHKQRGI